MKTSKPFEFTPENITTLPDNCIFVFGSNTEGIHGSGSAKTAIDNFGAIYGVPMGLQGNSYAIITKDFKRFGKKPSTEYLEDMGYFILSQILNLYAFAEYYPNKYFVVTKIGCGLAGFSVKNISDIFKHISEQTEIPENIILPKEFT